MDPEKYLAAMRSDDESGDEGASLEELERVLDALGIREWARIGNRAYPPQYALSLGSHRASPTAVQRLRGMLARVPRVDPSRYDILYNAEGSDFRVLGPTWDVVKWIQVPELQGYLPGLGWISSTHLFEPYPVYHILAEVRGPMSLGDLDYQVLLRNSVVHRGGGRERTREIRERNREKEEARRRDRAEADLAFGEYYRGLFKKAAEERGI